MTTFATANSADEDRPLEGHLESVVAMVNDASGHYKPDGRACLQHVHKKLTELGIPTQETQWFWRDK